MEVYEELVDAINVALGEGDWQTVALLTVALYEAAITVGETDVAELVEDLHCIAQDALVRPLVVAKVLEP
jgi:hypothetical protein